jgi:hypothetical protein
MRAETDFLPSLPPGAMAPVAVTPRALPQPRNLTEADAVDIWIARWLRIRRKDLLDRYGCDPRRLYEIWAEERFAGSRAKAIKLFTERHPGLTDRIDYGRHHRVSRTTHPDQLSLFE